MGRSVVDGVKRERGPRLLRAAALACAVGSCGGSHATPTHVALPKIDDNGGGILTAPSIVTVTFAPSLYTNAPSTLVSDLQAFDDGITATAWWQTVTSDYCDAKLGCIGANLASGGHVAIDALPQGDGSTDCGMKPDGTPVTPCLSDSAVGGTASIKQYLAKLFADGTLPAPTPQSLYLLFFPSSVTISVDGSLSCVEIGGYHNSLSVGSLDVPYAVVPVCDPEMTAKGIPMLSVAQTATLAASHEIIEAVTDPHGGEVPAGGDPFSTEFLGYYLTDVNRQAWGFLAGGEVADLCVDLFGLGQDRWSEGKFTYQRVWSNSSAAAGRDPCVPSDPAAVYFNAGPSTVKDEETRVAAGASGSVNVYAFSDGTGNWGVSATDIGTTAGTANDVLSFTPAITEPTTVHDGSAVSLKVRVTGPLPMQPGEPPGTPAFEPYIVISAANIGGVPTAHYWPGFIVAP